MNSTEYATLNDPLIIEYCLLTYCVLKTSTFTSKNPIIRHWSLVIGHRPKINTSLPTQQKTLSENLPYIHGVFELISFRTPYSFYLLTKGVFHKSG